MLATEIRKAFGNTWFIVATLFGCLLALISATGNIILYHETMRQILEWWGIIAPNLSASSCFRFFITSDYIQPSTDLFYALVPLLAALPYGWSLCSEKRRGYLNNVFVKSKRGRYFFAKAFAAATSGFAVVVLPLLLNCLICACFIPAYSTDIATVFNTGIYDSIMALSLYYSCPVLFVGFYIVLTGLFGAAWAVFALFLGGYAYDSVRLIAGLFVCLYLFGALDYKIGILLTGSGTEYVSLSPLIWLRGVAINGHTDIAAVLVWLSCLTMISIVLALRLRKGDVL